MPSGARTAREAAVLRDMVTSASTKMFSLGLKEQSRGRNTVRTCRDGVLGAAVISVEKACRMDSSRLLLVTPGAVK